jgi:hypothetical protein
MADCILPSGAKVTTSIPATATVPSGALTVQPKRPWSWWASRTVVMVSE